MARAAGWGWACRWIAACALALSWSSSIFASEAPRIGYVDIPFLIEKAPQAIAAGERLENSFGAQRVRLDQLRKDLGKERERLQAERKNLPEFEITERELKLRQMERRLESDEREFVESFSLKRNEEFKRVRQAILEAVVRYGRQNGYELILSDGVVFASRDADVTEAVMKLLTEERTE